MIAGSSREQGEKETGLHVETPEEDAMGQGYWIIPVQGALKHSLTARPHFREADEVRPLQAWLPESCEGIKP